ncbi:MAG: AI-2E family transporter, partial [Planctomycetota bacterium]
MAAKKDASTNSTGLFTLVTLLSFSLIGSVAWMATNQVVELSMKLPDYKDNLITKIRSVRHQAGGNVLEPWLYGSSTGVSSFGVILAAIFWTWLWGPIGLVLAMPLTVC